MNNHIIFGISGRAQSGKTTLANHIVEQLSYGGSHDTLEYSVRILSFADYLKKILADLFLVDDYYLNDDVGKTRPTQYTWSQIMGLSYNDSYMTGRELMEYFGAEFRRINPMAWVNGVVSQIKNTSKKTIFIIPDVRSPNEIDALKELGGYNLRLTRNPLNRDSIIETALDVKNYDYKNFDYILHNVNCTEEEKNRLGFEQFLKLTNFVSLNK